ncbi:MAG: hypothetical protein KUG77_00150 [Nannocystaceae bacterium]|nr:hypothetical protein [Nannocystaceae bacterium]
MNRTFWLLVAAYFVVTMGVAYPWHIFLFHEEYVTMGAFTRGQPLMPFGMAAVTLQGVVFAYFYPLFYRHIGGGSPVKRGVQFSLLLGLIVYTVMVFSTVAKFNIEPILDFVALETGFEVLQFCAVGVAFGLIYGHGAPENPERLE